jgi:uncharacterized protein GlcG (DUF336 family)
MPMTLRQARQIVDACVSKATELGISQAVAVVDAAGDVITLDRMDGVKLGREEFARGKAFAAVFYRRPTKDSVKMLETSPDQYYSGLAMFPGKMFIVRGGFPIEVDGELVGGLGVSGATGEQDEIVAQAGLATLG